ncbi:hypothetical protein [Streptomyces sp. NBC_01565]|uniref:hypothetical protein n=1 Tax=unclassified Streptomyces TaxID=2593676 RepID=UPI002252AA1F|nr:hypothetical protein [Streptomyces sp. NBC_01565]MCX4546563.1 hypothetical protein [Streptomyces sp. NBC_01565]
MTIWPPESSSPATSAPNLENPVLAICGNIEDANDRDLATRVLVPIEHTIPGEARYAFFTTAAAR